MTLSADIQDVTYIPLLNKCFAAFTYIILFDYITLYRSLLHVKQRTNIIKSPYNDDDIFVVIIIFIFEIFVKLSNLITPLLLIITT